MRGAGGATKFIQSLKRSILVRRARSTIGSGACFEGSGIPFVRGIGVTGLRDMPEVLRQVLADRAGLLVLLHVMQFVRQAALGEVAMPDVDAVAEGQAGHGRAPSKSTFVVPPRPAAGRSSPVSVSGVPVHSTSVMVARPPWRIRVTRKLSPLPLLTRNVRAVSTERACALVLWLETVVPVSS